MDIELRPIKEADLTRLSGGESPFDDFGPRVPRSQVPNPTLREAGALAVWRAQDMKLLGDVTWIWNQWGPTPESRKRLYEFLILNS